jgi:signal transduction histidine kinase
MHDAVPPDFQTDIDAIGRIAAVPTILDVVCRTTGMGFAAVARVTADHWVACGVQDGIAFGLKPGGMLPIETTICREVQRHGKPVIIDDTARDNTYAAHPAPAQYGFRSYVSVPIVMPDGRVFGTLCAIDPQPRALNKPEVIGTFRLFAELIAFHLDANERIAKSDALLARERELAQFREEFIAVLGHDLRNPLASVSAGNRLLLRHPDRAAEIIGHSQQSIARMAGLIDNVMDFARGRFGGGLNLHRASTDTLGPALLQVVREFQTTHPNRAIHADIALAGPIDCDTGRIGQLLSNLLGNALAHGDPAEPVTVQGHVSANTLTLTVANAGAPIPEAAMAHLFRPFVRAALREHQQGLGLGLYIAAEIARAHGGTIAVDSTAQQTRFTFHMPKE